MILILDNFINKEECKRLIKYHQKHKSSAASWPIGATGPCAHQLCYPDITLKLFHDVLTRAQEKVHRYFDKEMMTDRADLIKHDVGATHRLHYDTQYAWTRLASVIYLNTLSSGHTIFTDGLKVSPREGRIILFDGQTYKHGVSKVLDKERYSIPIWYRYLK